MKILFFLLFSLSFTSVFAVGETSPELGSYEGYKENVKIFCKPTDSNLWVDRKDDNLIKIEEVPYSDISKREAGDAKYTAYLTSIKADSSKINFLSLGIGPQFLNKASFVYKETMSSIYSCAVMNAKVRIINNLLSNKKLQSTQSNMSTKLKGQLTRMRMDMSKK